MAAILCCIYILASSMNVIDIGVEVTKAIHVVRIKPGPLSVASHVTRVYML
jgi:hypothetical protein